MYIQLNGPLQALGITTQNLGSQNKVDNIQGLVVSAPYLACAVLGCWLTEPLNRIFGRRGTIFISCFIAAAASIWEGFTYSWPQLFAARFVLGLGIGTKSATVPVYTAECAPAMIRGALVMQWQVWTAFGIMVRALHAAVHRNRPLHLPPNSFVANLIDLLFVTSLATS